MADKWTDKIEISVTELIEIRTAIKGWQLIIEGILDTSTGCPEPIEGALQTLERSMWYALGEDDEGTLNLNMLDSLEKLRAYEETNAES